MKSIFKRIAVVTAIVAIVSFAIDLAIGFAFGTIQSIYRGDFHFLGEGSYGHFTVDESESVSAAGIRGIVIDTVGETIKIREVPGNSITARYHGTLNATAENRPTLQVRQEGSTAKICIRWTQSTWVAGPKFDNTTLEIGIPKTYAGSLSTESVSGDIGLDGHSYAGLALKTVSGNIEGKTAAKELNAESTSGDVSLALAQMPQKIKAHTVSGDIEIGLPKDAAFKLTASTVSGGVQCDFPVAVKYPSRERNTLTGTVVNGKNTVSAESVSGAVDITRN